MGVVMGMFLTGLDSSQHADPKYYDKPMREQMKLQWQYVA